MDDLPPEYWLGQSRRLDVINGIQRMIDDEPDRFTGLHAHGPDRVVLYVVDPSAVDGDRLLTLLDEARVADVDVTIAAGGRSRRELVRINDEILRTRLLDALGVTRAEWWIDPPSAAVRIAVDTASVDVVRAAFASYGPAVDVVAAELGEVTE